MHINDYSTLIKNLPVRQQAFTTNRGTWAAAEQQFPWLMELNADLFQNHASLQLSRQDIFNTDCTRTRIIKTIYWGYPRGMRGNHFIKILKYNNNNIETLIQVLDGIRDMGLPAANDYQNILAAIGNIDGIGLSTFSKLLYFMNITFDKHPCLILDSRLIKVFSQRTFDEFAVINDININNAANRYLCYLRITQAIADCIQTHGENIEQFLFLFGNHLKEWMLP